MADLLLTETHDGSVARVRVGDAIVLSLAENPTTGYRWKISATAPLAAVADDFQAADFAAGSGGRRIARFTASAAGGARIEAELCRSWQPDAALRRFVVTIEIAGT